MNADWLKLRVVRAPTNRRLECSHPHKKRVKIGERGKEISSPYCWNCFYQEMLIWNCRFKWGVDTILFRC